MSGSQRERIRAQADKKYPRDASLKETSVRSINQYRRKVR